MNHEYAQLFVFDIERRNSSLDMTQNLTVKSCVFMSSFRKRLNPSVKEDSSDLNKLLDYLSALLLFFQILREDVIS